MKVREFHVSGYRSLKNTDVSGLATKNIFYGDNGSGKTNLLLILETIFRQKESKPGIALERESLGEDIPLRPTPFWSGLIPDFDENFYMGKDNLIKFNVLLLVAPKFFAKFDDQGILASLQECGHDFRVNLSGKIERIENNAAMKLTEVKINNKLAMQQKNGNIKWLPNVSADAADKQRIVEDLLDSFTNQIRIIPASRYLSEEEYSTKEVMLSSENFKNWLHKISLSRDGYQTFKRIKNWLANPPFEVGEISFVMENDRLELMVEDDIDYRIKAENKGSGIQQILVLLGFIAESNAAIIGVEEPELNLSFKNQDNVINILRGMVDDSADSPHQILLTSHSDHIGSREDLSCYYVEKNEGTDTVVRHFKVEDRAKLFPRLR